MLFWVYCGFASKVLCVFLDEIMQDLETRVQIHFAKLADDIQQQAAIEMIKQLICLICYIRFC